MSITKARVGGYPKNFLVEETRREKVLRARPTLRRKNCPAANNLPESGMTMIMSYPGTGNIMTCHSGGNKGHCWSVLPYLVWLAAGYCISR